MLDLRFSRFLLSKRTKRSKEEDSKFYNKNALKQDHLTQLGNDDSLMNGLTRITSRSYFKAMMVGPFEVSAGFSGGKNPGFQDKYLHGEHISLHSYHRIVAANTSHFRG